MKLQIDRKYIRIAAVVLTVIWMVVIYSYSAQEAAVSSATSMSVSYKIVSATDKMFGLNWQDERILKAAEAIEEAIRKIAHMIEYGILASFAGISLDCWYKSISIRRIVFDIIICAVYAASDEIHQLFVPGRFGCVRDVFIDLSGAILFIAVIVLLRRHAIHKGK